MSPLQETYLVFAHEMKRSLRSAKTLVLLILYGLATVVSGLIFVAASRALQEQLNSRLQGQELPPEALTQFKMGGLSAIFGKNDAQLHYLASIPLIVTFFALFALFVLPLVTALLGFDQVSGELQSRSIRFVSLRVRRGSLLAGKVMAQLALLVSLTAIINLGVFAFAAFYVSGFQFGAGLLALARFWSLTLFYATAYVGLATLCSTLFRAPIFSLLVNISVLVAFVMIGFMSNFENLSFLAYVVPSHYKDGLFSPDPLAVVESVGVYSAYAAGFLGLAFFTLRARDI
jgi:ABC-2 type transport system permease protein